MLKMTSFLGCLLLTALVCFHIAYAEVVVVIPDPNLEAVIRETIGKPEGDITDTDLQTITQLDGHYRGIIDLTGLEYCTNLTWLNLDSNQIADITPLANLTALTELSLGFNLQITDITPLSNLTALTYLFLDFNYIADITPLANLTALTYLALMFNKITDITPLSNLTALTKLDLYSNQITDIQPLVDNPGIGSGDYVSLYNNPLSYISLKTHIPTLEGRGVDVYYPTKGTVSLDIAGPPTWSYTLTHQSDYYIYIYNWFYEGSGITGASVTGEAAAAGWTVEYTPTLVTFSNSTPMTSGSVSGFEITGAKGGTGSWLCGRGTGSIEGPVSQLGDVSGNGTVSAYDAAMVLQYVVGLITLTDAQKEAADVNKSGVITALDAALILQYTVGLITQFPAQKGAPILTAKEENQILTKIIAELENDTSDSRNGPDRDGAHLTADQKHVLEQLKQLIWRQSLPGHTALLQNYPNPFNPETWIPYELAQDASVTIRIYDVKGQIVRQLDLGKQKAGRYVDKEKAAHWDGKDQTGKAASSGLYFYTLKAGNFQATRRMVIVK
jgi:hypothetical protein